MAAEVAGMLLLVALGILIKAQLKRRKKTGEQAGASNGW